MKVKDYLLNVLTGIDQLGNAISGGDPDVTVSGRIGYHSLKSNTRFWRMMERIVDWTFEPVDGPLHCYTTFKNDNDIDYGNHSTFSLMIMSLIAIPTCIVLTPVIRLLALFI